MIKIKENLKRIFNFIKKHKYSSVIVFVALLISIFYYWDNIRSNMPFETPGFNIEKKKEERVRAPLSGVLVEQERAKRRPIAVVIDNHSNARPQSGLSKASIVFETFAEGGITRLLAIFQENDAEEIGPVRSARVEFVQWASELDAIFAHVGGSQGALALISQTGVLDFNQFTNGSFFTRDNQRYAPHNVYTTTNKIKEGANKLKYSTEKTIESFNFKEDIKKEERVESGDVVVPFSGNLYAVRYVYDKESNSYKRFIGGVPHIDQSTKEQILAKNIIVQYTDITDRAGLDTHVNAIGKGRLEYYQDGKKYEGSWGKTTAKTRTRYLDLDNNEIVLNAGTTWIEVTRR